jgi:hypothetical protein
MSGPKHTLHGAATAYRGQWLYLFGDEGVVYSETQNRFAGLDAGGVSAYRAFDAGASVQDLEPLYDATLGLALPDERLRIVHALSQGRFPADSPRIEFPALNNPQAANIEISGIPICLQFPGELPLNPCLDIFKSCLSAEGPAQCHLWATRAKLGWTIYRNGVEFQSLLQDEQLGLGFLHTTRSLLYDEAGYDIAFHAAMVAHGDAGIMLCAPREAGKSTLAAYMMAHSFDLMTDEPALLHLDTGSVSSLCLPVSLKEGSWHVLREEWPQLATAPVHVRSDGTRIRMLHPPPSAVSTPSAHLTRIVFPEYGPSSTTQVDRLSPFRTLSLLDAGGMVLAKHLAREGFEAFLEMLCVTPAFRLQYSSLEEAANAIQCLASETSHFEC